MKKGRKSKKKKSNDNIKLLYFFVGVVLLLGTTLYFLGNKELKSPSPHTRANEVKIKNIPLAPKKAEKKVKDLQSEEETPSLPRLAIIIDDIGFTKAYTNLIRIKLPITYAIIPYTIYSVEAANEATKAGMEVILHLPMEPKAYPEKDPGKGGLLISMDENSIINKVREDLDLVPHIKGVNNHMGSRFTEYGRGMKLVLSEIKKRDLYFIDSKTSYKSKAYTIAKGLNIRSAERDVFLDNIQTEEAIEKQLEEAISIAKEKGEAIAIGHPYASTIATLSRMAPDIKEMGVELVFASTLTK